MSDADHSQYKVGYKRPPHATQFKPGQTGNAKGRRKGSKNVATALKDELKSRVTVTENGRRRTISKGEAIAKQTVNKAVSGDPKATQMVLNEIRPHEKSSNDGPEHEILASPEDKLVVENIIKRILQRNGKDSPSSPTAETSSELAPEAPPSKAEE